MRIIIHGGMHKTGTKSLQHLLAENRNLLAAEGICYPAAPEIHHELYLIAKQEGWDPRRCVDLVRQAERAHFNTIILSSETVSTFSADQIRKLDACFAGYDRKYVFCFRHWSGYLPSRWVQNSRRRDTQTFDAYVRMVSAPDSRHIDIRYDLVLAHVAGSGCEVAAVSYDNSVAQHGSVVPDLLEALEIPQTLVGKLTSRERRLNQREEWALVEISRLLNGIFADRWRMPQDDRCRSLGEHRPCDAFFDLDRKFVALDPAIKSSLSAIVAKHAVTRVAGVNDLAVLDAVAHEHGHRFTNLIDGRIFPDAPGATFTTTDLVWQDFRDLAGPSILEVAARWERKDPALRNFAQAIH